MVKKASNFQYAFYHITLREYHKRDITDFIIILEITHTKLNLLININIFLIYNTISFIHPIKYLFRKFMKRLIIKSILHFPEMCNIDEYGRK